MSSANHDLIEAARQAWKHAYCPYSRFPVGAAVHTVDGRVFSGSNIENASYGLTICAERAAIFTAIGAGARRIDRIAVSCQKKTTKNLDSLMPCGACRQVMREFMNAKADVIVDGAGVFTLGVLLPRAFRLKDDDQSRKGRAKHPKQTL